MLVGVPTPQRSMADHRALPGPFRPSANRPSSSASTRNIAVRPEQRRRDRAPQRHPAVVAVGERAGASATCSGRSSFSVACAAIQSSVASASSRRPQSDHVPAQEPRRAAPIRRLRSRRRAHSGGRRRRATSSRSISRGRADHQRIVRREQPERRGEREQACIHGIGAQPLGRMIPRGAPRARTQSRMRSAAACSSARSSAGTSASRPAPPRRHNSEASVDSVPLLARAPPTSRSWAAPRTSAHSAAERRAPSEATRSAGRAVGRARRAPRPRRRSRRAGTPPIPPGRRRRRP